MALPTMALSTRVGPSVQLTEPIRPTKAIKQMRNQPIWNSAHKKVKKTEPEPGCIDYQPGKTRMAAVHETTLPAVRIKLTKAVTSLLVNIKPTRSRGTSKNVTIQLPAR